MQKYLQSQDEKNSHKNRPQQIGVVSGWLHFQIIMEICADILMDAYDRFAVNLRANTDIIGHFAGAIWLNHPDVVCGIVECEGSVHFIIIFIFLNLLINNKRVRIGKY
jgi:hypothetical protein